MWDSMNGACAGKHQARNLLSAALSASVIPIPLSTLLGAFTWQTDGLRLTFVSKRVGPFNINLANLDLSERKAGT
jgi:hypothetical protein